MSQASICGSLDSNVEPNHSEEEGNSKPAEVESPTDNATMITMKHVGHNPSYEKTTDAPLTFQGRVAPLDRAEEEDRSSVYAAIQAEFDNAFATESETSNNTNESITTCNWEQASPDFDSNIVLEMMPADSNTKEKRFLHLLQKDVVFQKEDPKPKRNTNIIDFKINEKNQPRGISMQEINEEPAENTGNGQDLNCGSPNAELVNVKDSANDNNQPGNKPDSDGHEVMNSYPGLTDDGQDLLTGLPKSDSNASEDSDNDSEECASQKGIGKILSLACLLNVFSLHFLLQNGNKTDTTRNAVQAMTRATMIEVNLKKVTLKEEVNKMITAKQTIQKWRTKYQAQFTMMEITKTTTGMTISSLMTILDGQTRFNKAFTHNWEKNITAFVRSTPFLTGVQRKFGHS